ncbi:MAG TPA: serine/threonine-protein kinase [Kofleriaceae bacterium]
MATRFGAYEILYELKSGGMGAVLLGRRRGPGTFEQLVAIKTIRPEYAQAPAVRAMFLDEAAILARLNHPGIATVHDFGEEGGTLYMVMEYVAGIPLRDLGEHVMPPAIAARAIAEAGRGLNAAHEARDPSGTLMGLVHRDISPDNLMLGYDGHVKVIDFGIALVKNRQAPVTEFGTVKGKPPYMSPEQVKNEPMDRRSDVWALGVVAWELLTGKGLFDGDSIYAIALAVEQQELLPPSRAGGRSLPTGLDAAVMGALHRDLTQRTPTAAALSEALEQVIQAAGGETLAAWAERELEDQRVKHRAWLASVTAGATTLPRAASRPTDQPTQVGPIAAVAEAVAMVPPPGALAEPSPATSIGRELDDLAAPPPNRRGVVLLLLLALLIGSIAVYFVFHTTDETKPPVKVADAAVGTSDAPLIVQPGPIDAAPIAIDAEIDAATIDAGGRTMVNRHHAGVKIAPVDAAPMAVVPTGTGTVTIKFSGDTYSNVTLDGDQLTPPVYKHKLPAGHHVIKFFHPKTGKLLDTQAIDVKDAEHLDVTQH